MIIFAVALVSSFLSFFSMSIIMEILKYFIKSNQILRIQLFIQFALAGLTSDELFESSWEDIFY